MKYMKTILLSVLLLSPLFSATPEQVEQYIAVSNSEEQLLELENQFSQMQNNINQIKSEDAATENTYDMQLLSIRFREYLQKNLSENEMDEILKVYRNVVLLQFVSVQNDEEYDEKAAREYMKRLENEENATLRPEILEKISENLYNTDNIGILFDNLMKPLLENSMGAESIDSDTMKKSREAYIRKMIESGRVETAFSTKEFTIEELESLLEIVKSSAVSKESKAVFGATAYALQEFFMSIASRYDINKHKR